MLILGHLGESHLAWDPVTLALLIILGWLFLSGPAGRSRTRRVFFAGGLVAVAGAVATPLESLAAELASAHMAQHVLLVMVAGPLLAVSRPIEGLLAGLPRPWRKRVGRARRVTRLTPDKRRLFSPVAAWLAYAGSLWAWHAVSLYELALDREPVHLLEHLCFLGASVGFWSLVFKGRNRQAIAPGYRALMVFTTAFHSVFLAALLTFADTPWYPSYAETAQHWGLTPIDDQRLAGLLMWIPGTLLYTAVGLWLLLRWVRQTDQSRSVSEIA